MGRPLRPLAILVADRTDPMGNGAALGVGLVDGVLLVLGLVLGLAVIDVEGDMLGVGDGEGNGGARSSCHSAPLVDPPSSSPTAPVTILSSPAAPDSKRAKECPKLS